MGPSFVGLSGRQAQGDGTGALSGRQVYDSGRDTSPGGSNGDRRHARSVPGNVSARLPARIPPSRRRPPGSLRGECGKPQPSRRGPRLRGASSEGLFQNRFPSRRAIWPVDLVNDFGDGVPVWDRRAGRRLARVVSALWASEVAAVDVGQGYGPAQVTRIPPLRRSKILVSSFAYWRGVGDALTSMSHSTRRRHRTIFFGGGCLFWLVVIWAIWLFYFLVATLVLTFLAGVAAIGALWSGIGWIDEGRLALQGRAPQYRLPVRRPARRLGCLGPRPPSSLTAELKRLGELHQSGVLNDEEFAAGKAKLLG